MVKLFKFNSIELNVMVIIYMIVFNGIIRIYFYVFDNIGIYNGDILVWQYIGGDYGIINLGDYIGIEWDVQY